MDEGASNKGGGTKEEVTPQIDGNSSMADMSRSFLQLANPLKDVAFSVDASICRPRASEPDHHKATLIICVLAFTLISIVVQVSFKMLQFIFNFFLQITPTSLILGLCSTTSAPDNGLVLSNRSCQKSGLASNVHSKQSRSFFPSGSPITPQKREEHGHQVAEGNELR